MMKRCLLPLFVFLVFLVVLVVGCGPRGGPNAIVVGGGPSGMTQETDPTATPPPRDDVLGSDTTEGTPSSGDGGPTAPQGPARQDNPPMAGPGEDTSPRNTGPKWCAEGDEECLKMLLGTFAIERGNICSTPEGTKTDWSTVRMTVVRVADPSGLASITVSHRATPESEYVPEYVPVDPPPVSDPPDASSEEGFQLVADSNGHVSFRFGPVPLAGYYQIKVRSDRGYAEGGIPAYLCDEQGRVLLEETPATEPTHEIFSFDEGARPYLQYRRFYQPVPMWLSPPTPPSPSDLELRIVNPSNQESPKRLYRIP